MKPIVKWAGGKTRLIKHISPLIPESINRYIEPFFGGGAIFLRVDAKKYLINDINNELMNLYKVVKENPDSLIKELKKHVKNDNKEYFLRIREWDKKIDFNKIDSVKRAGRFVYLNKTVFGGLYRVNSDGYFNVPYAENINGKEILNEQNLKLWSEKLSKNVVMKSKDFEKIIDSAKEGDFIFCDPPYFEWSKTANFTSYTKDGFSIDDQKRLKDSLMRASDRGAKFMITNSGTEEVKNFYKGLNLKKIDVVRTIAASKRKTGYSEYIITNY